MHPSPAQSGQRGEGTTEGLCRGAYREAGLGPGEKRGWGEEAHIRTGATPAATSLTQPHRCRGRALERSGGPGEHGRHSQRGLGRGSPSERSRPRPCLSAAQRTLSRLHGGAGARSATDHVRL